MKIAILSPFTPYRGGIAQFNMALYAEMEKEHEVRAYSFATLYPNILFPGKTQFLTEEEYNPYPDNERLLSSVNPATWKRTAKAINKFAPDALILPYWIPYLAPALAGVAKHISKSTKILGLIHNAMPHEKGLFDAILAKHFFKRCHSFVVLSELVKGELAKMIKGQKPIQVIPHPIYDRYKEKDSKEEACAQLHISPNKKTILFFGFIRDYKGLDILIKTMNELGDTYQLIIAGECYGKFDNYQELINNSKNKDNIILFQQYIVDSLVSTLFSASDVLVLPYRSATQSGVLSVAYQMEIPVIVTNVGAIGQMVNKAGVGLVASEAKADIIAQSIQKYFREDNAQYIVNLKKEKDRLSWSNFARAVQSFIFG